MACSFGKSKPADVGQGQPEVVATETEAPADVSSGQDTFTDSFDRAAKAWTDPVIVTSQASGREPYIKVTSGDGVMRFAISDKETYVYMFLKGKLEGAATIEADFQNKGAVNTSIALVCKANQDQTSWYELRISAADYNYVFFQYDKKRKDEEGKNPYIQLSKGHMKGDEYFATKPNHIVFTCTNTELTVDINKGKKQASLALENPIEGHLFGVGVLSADIQQNTIDFETVTVR
jgi:hypothetical protein